MGEEVNPIRVDNNGAIASPFTLKFSLKQVVDRFGVEDARDLVSEIRVHPKEWPGLIASLENFGITVDNVVETKGRVDMLCLENFAGRTFGGIPFFKDPTIPSDEIQLRDRDGKLLVKIVNVGKIRESGEK